MLMAAQHSAHHPPGAAMSGAAGDGREATEDFLAQQREEELGGRDDGTIPAPSSPPAEDNDGAETASEAAATEPAATEPAATEPAATESAATEAAATEAASTEAASTEATVTEAAVTEASATKSAETEAAAREAMAPEVVPAAPALMARDEGRVSTPPPMEGKEEERDVGGDDDGHPTSEVTPPCPRPSPLRFMSPPRSAGRADLQARVDELEQTVAALLEVLQGQQLGAGGQYQTTLAPQTPLRPTASQLCLHPLDSPSPTPRNNKPSVRQCQGQQGVLSVPDLDEDNGNFSDGGTQRRSPIPEPPPDLEYRTYTAEYEEELKKIRADRQRGMSFDVAEMVEQKLREEALAETEAGEEPSSSSSSSKGSSQSSLVASPPKLLGGASAAKKDDVDSRARSATKDSGLPPSVPKRIRSSGKLNGLEEEPTTPKETQQCANSSPKGVEEAPNGVSATLSADRTAVPLSAANKAVSNETDSDKAEASQATPMPPPPTGPRDGDKGSLQKPLKLALKRTPLTTAAVVSALKQESESEENQETIKSKKEKIRRKGSNVTLPPSPPEVLKSTPSNTSKKSTPQPQQKVLDSAPQKVAAPVSIFSYIKNDLLSNMNLDSKQQDGSASEDVDANMQEFIKVPSRLESLLFFGLAICTDCFLYVLAFLPLKFLWSCICLACTILRPGKGIRGCRFHRRHLYQILLILVIWAVYRHVLVPISIGKLYHWIRGQAMIKLYVMIAIVEVFDRLMCSLGQDSLDSLYWNTTRRPCHMRTVISTVVVLVYATLHSLILFVHIATLNVAMNSSDQALLTLLISGNFAEIKSTVFKKYNKQNLFKITTSDICERFKLMLFLGLILLLNCFQGGMNRHMIEDYIKVSAVVMIAEMTCDWIKHSFITKFNFIKSSAYPDYALILAGDVTGVGHEGINLNHTHAVVKRLGFSQIPLVCIFARYIREALRYGVVMSGENGTGSHHFFERFAALYTTRNWSAIAAIVLGIFHCLVAMKIVLGYSVLKASRRLLDGPTPTNADNGHSEKKEMTAGESAKQEKATAPRRQAV